ncbi:GNAT family N-acetyltransferase [Actinoplanes sp. NPDC049316]|uniref:GNAT family N-acetyltransferase n=1 Tax=Actinoplanes sp. NPDC049316 TaxID=3154727 RepID=UPI003427DF72
MTVIDIRRRPTIRQAARRDMDPIVDLLAAVFARTSLGRHLVGDDQTRQHTIRRYFRIVVPHAMTHGHVDVIGAGRAAAIWYPINGPASVTIPGYAPRLAEATGAHLSRFVDLDTARTKHQPVDRPHHRLGYLAVPPDLRQQGIGTQLLEHHHRQLDTAGLPAYVEATGARDSRLFVRHGYDPKSPFPAGTQAPQLYPMWREPRQ